MFKKLLVLGFCAAFLGGMIAATAPKAEAKGFSSSSRSFSSSRSYSAPKAPRYKSAPKAPKRVVVNKTVVNKTYVNKGTQSGGQSMLGTAAGVAGGVVAGNLLTHALLSDNSPSSQAVVNQIEQKTGLTPDQLKEMTPDQLQSLQSVLQAQPEQSLLSQIVGWSTGLFIIALMIGLVILMYRMIFGK